MKPFKRRRLLPLLAVLPGAALALPTAAMADDRPDRDHDRDRGSRGAVYVQTNEAAGNRILAYRRGHDGSLGRPRSYSTCLLYTSPSPRD